MTSIAAHPDLSILAVGGRTGPSFTAALCGFLSTTLATTALMFLLSSL